MKFTDKLTNKRLRIKSTDSKARAILYNALNSTTRKYCSLALISIATYISTGCAHS